MRRSSLALIINGYECPAPDEGFTVRESTYGTFQRNSNLQIVGQKQGRPLWKIENLCWSELTVEQWTAMKTALEPYFVNVTFTTDTNERLTKRMYPSDRQGNPIEFSGVENGYKRVKSCKFNLIDCGY